MLDAAARALRPGGRLVVNAVTLETEALLLARHAALGGELIRIAISRAGAGRRKNRLARRDAGDAMGMDKAMIVAGVGCKRGAAAPDIEAAIRAALARAGIASDALDAIATIAAKQDEAGIEAAAAKLGVAVVAGVRKPTSKPRATAPQPAPSACSRSSACRRSPRPRRSPPPVRRRACISPRLVDRLRDLRARRFGEPAP